MRDEKFKEFKEFKKEGHHRGERHKGRGGSHERGAKTFRRGRAIAFLERLTLKRLTIMQQLEKPEFQSIQPILVGELKAIDMVISEFTQLFEIHENEVTEIPGSDENADDIILKRKQPSEHDEGGNDINESN